MMVIKENKNDQSRTISPTGRLRARELEILDWVTARINAGLMLEDILEKLYQDFHYLMPYNRIGVSLIDDEAIVRLVWAKSDRAELKIGKDYSAPLSGSSLNGIAKNGEPRVINDLAAYLEQKPSSESTRLIVAEGIRSSLTCPLFSSGEPIGFIFFSSNDTNAYQDIHVDMLKRIAGQLSVIIEKGRLTSELARQNDELNRLVEMKNKFLGIAAHDIRHPIGYIQLATQLILDETEEPTGIDTVEILKGIQKQVDHAIKLLNSLLDITAFDAKGAFLDIESFEMKAFIETAVSHQNPIAAMKDSKIVLDEIPDGTILADPKWIQQVVENLISNAVKFSPPGSTVRVIAQQMKSGWRIAVQDNGPGITPADHKIIFQDFARLSAKPTGGEKSTGLGLSIARRVVEAHGGVIGVDDAPGTGSVFWFTIPGK